MYHFLYRKASPELAALVTVCKRSGNGLEALRLMTNAKDAPSEDDALKIELEVQSLVKSLVKSIGTQEGRGLHRQEERGIPEQNL